MTKIAIQGGKVVLRDGKVGTGTDCCCEDCDPPCRRCEAACLTATFADFSGEVGDCDCADLNGTYLLTRGIGRRPRVRVRVIDADGVDAVITVTLDFDTTNGTYFVDTATLVKAGVNYSPDATVELTVLDGIIACNDPPILTLQFGRIAPPQPPAIAFETDVTQGGGAQFTADWQPVSTTAGAETWGINALTVVTGGRGYKDRDFLRIVLRTNKEAEYEVAAFEGVIVIDHAEPVLDDFQIDTVGGAGATFNHTWDINQDIFDLLDPLGVDGRYWYMDSLTIANGGTGYEVGDTITYTLSGRHDTWQDAEGPFFVATVLTVDVDGAITSLAFDPPEDSHFKTIGEIQSVVIEADGEYFRYDSLEGVTVTAGGTIWPTGGADDSPCVYSLCQEVLCGEETKCRKITLDIQQNTRTLTVTHDDTVIASAELPAEGNPCDDMTFTSEDASEGGCEFGTVAISEGTCTGPPAEEVCCPAEACVDTCADPQAAMALWADGMACSPADIACNETQRVLLCDLNNAAQTTDAAFLPDPTPYSSYIGNFIAQFGGSASNYIDLSFFHQVETGSPVDKPYTYITRAVGIVAGIYGCSWYLWSVSDFIFTGIDRPGNFSEGFHYKYVTNPAATSPRDISNPVTRIDRGFCIAEEGDKIQVRVNATGVTFGGEFSAFNSDTYFDGGDDVTELPTYDHILAQPVSWVIRPRVGCWNPLP